MWRSSYRWSKANKTCRCRCSAPFRSQFQIATNVRFGRCFHKVFWERNLGDISRTVLKEKVSPFRRIESFGQCESEIKDNNQCEWTKSVSADMGLQSVKNYFLYTFVTSYCTRVARNFTLYLVSSKASGMEWNFNQLLNFSRILTLIKLQILLI